MHPIVREDLEYIVSAPLDWEQFRGKTVLVTGANGFLPAYMVETLLFLNTTRNFDCHVLGLVRNMARAEARFADYTGRSDLSLIVADVSGEFQIHTACTFIIHAASQASPKYFGCDPVGTMTANLFGTHRLLELARSWSSEGILYFSSGEVYGQVAPDKIPTCETDYGYLDVLDPRSCYAESKRAAETLLVSHARQFSTPGVIVRPFHTYGPGMALDDGRVYADFTSDVINRRNIVLHGDGKAVRAFCYLADAVRGFFTALLKGERGQAYNIGNPAGALSIAELAELLTSFFPDLGLTVNRLNRTTDSYLPSPVSISSPNIDLISALGWQPHFSPKEGFLRTIRYFSAG